MGFLLIPIFIFSLFYHDNVTFIGVFTKTHVFLHLEKKICGPGNLCSAAVLQNSRQIIIYYLFKKIAPASAIWTLHLALL